MCIRVVITVACVPVLELQVLVIDEPLSILDTKLRRQVRDESREIQQRLSLSEATDTQFHRPGVITG